MQGNLNNACDVVESIIGRPVYAIDPGDLSSQLSDAEHRFVFSPGNSSTIAMTSPVADLMFAASLKYQWRGRGCCVVFRRSPLGMADRECLGVVIHEAAHWLAAADDPARDGTNHKQALASAWGSLKSQEEHHDKKWLRSLVHLWSRASVAGYKVTIANCLNLEQYRFKPSDLTPLLNEAESRRGESVEKILASPMPGATRKRKRRARPQLRGTSSRRSIRFHRVTVLGETTYHHDGSVVVAATLDSPRRRFESVAAFDAAVDRQRVGAAT